MINIGKLQIILKPCNLEEEFSVTLAGQLTPVNLLFLVSCRGLAKRAGIQCLALVSHIAGYVLWMRYSYLAPIEFSISASKCFPSELDLDLRCPRDTVRVGCLLLPTLRSGFSSPCRLHPPSGDYETPRLIAAVGFVLCWRASLHPLISVAQLACI